MDPLDILPAELWGMIFEKVEDGQDWLNLYRASSKFEGIVGGQRTRALLPTVFPHVAKYLDHDLNGMLLLRLVSKLWKDVLDKSFESPTDGIENVFSKFEWQYLFEDSATISAFLDKFNSHPGNTLIASFVRIALASRITGEEIREYKDSVIRLMDKYGSQIKRFCISSSNYVNATTDSFDNLIDMLISCARRAPNLEKLSVEFYDFAKADYPNEKLLQLHGNQQLPLISKLKSYSFSARGTRTSLVNLQNVIVRICCKPGTLKAVAMSGGFPHELTGFPNLEEVELSFQGEDYDDYDLDEDRSQLAMTSWPVTRLILIHYRRIIPLGEVMGFVEPFKGTLTSLEIRGDWITSDERGSQLRLDLPRLKSLRLPFRERNNFNGLANLINLEELRVRKNVLSEEDIKQLSDVLKGEILEFNVWEALPKLMKIKLMGFHVVQSFCKVYSREM